MTEQVNISLQDIYTVVSIIDICVKRGAIEGSELTTVGTIRDKFAAFIEQNKPKETKETKEPVETEN
jgi:hypothetical protein